MSACDTMVTKTTAKTNLAICDNCGEPHPVAMNPEARHDCHDPAVGDTFDDPTDPGHYVMAEHHFMGTNERCNGSGLCPMATSWTEKATPSQEHEPQGGSSQ